MHNMQTHCSPTQRQDALHAVLGSKTFFRNARLSKLLQYLCDKSIAGEAGSLKEYTIATDVFGRSADFDQSTDAIVRVEMHRLRKKLREYYASEGADQTVEIIFQSGNYAPEFLERRLEIVTWKEEELHLAPEPAPIELPAPARKKTLLWVESAVLALLFAGAIFAWLSRSQQSSPIAQTSPALGQAPAIAAISDAGAIRILSGRAQGTLRDRQGDEWGPDAFFEGGTAVAVPAQSIYRTRDRVLFQSARSGEFSYKIPLKQGIYELHLYFLDTAFKPGISMEGGENARFFDMYGNGRLLLHNLDIIASAGANTAYERVFKDVQPDKDGYLHLAFRKKVGDPLVNAIKILPGIPHRIRTVRISTQDSGFTDKFGNAWQPDDYFLNGRSTAKFGIIRGPDDPQIYERERYGNFSYAIPAAPGTYRLTLHLAETYFGPGQQGGGGVGDRIFDVYCNGIVLINQLDVFREAGAAHQVIKSFTGIQPNAQGNILLSFVPRSNYAMVSGLELIDESKQ